MLDHPLSEGTFPHADADADVTNTKRRDLSDPPKNRIPVPGHRNPNRGPHPKLAGWKSAHDYEPPPLASSPWHFCGSYMTSGGLYPVPQNPRWEEETGMHMF